MRKKVERVSFDVKIATFAARSSYASFNGRKLISMIKEENLDCFLVQHLKYNKKRYIVVR